MSKATNTPTTSRRGLLAGSGVGAILAGIGLPAAAVAPATAHPDAALIRICAEHIANWRAYNARPDCGGDCEEDPLWLAYERTRNAISDATPTTLDGLKAKAFVAKTEAMQPGGREEPDGGPQAAWAWDLVNDLVSGRVGA